MIRINNTQYFHFLQQADALRRAGLLCDAIISVQSQTFRAHRLVLACASRRLAQQLTQGDTDSPVHCSLELFSPHTFQQVLDFTYTQALEVPVDDLRLLLRAAQLLEIQSLEDQCQKQLDTLDCRTTAKEERGEIAEATETADETGQRHKGSLMTEETLQGNPSPVEEASYSLAVENPLPSDPPEGNTSPPSPRKKQRMSPKSATPYKRDSVIARPATSPPSFSSPWAFPKNMWHPMNALKRMAQNFIAARPLQPSAQAVAYPFPFSTPHMLPLLASSFPSQVHSSVIGYSGVHHPYTQNLYTGSPGMGDIVKQSLLGGKKASHKAFIGTIPSSEPRHAEEHRARTQRVKDCQHCSASLLSNPLLQESTTSTSSAEACAGHRFCGRGDEMRTLQSHRHDHGIEKPYQCQHCPKRFSLKHQLDTHHRVHTGEKPFECRLCGQRSRDYSAMIKHLRTHGGAAPYQCTVCLEFCSSLVAMQRHVKSHAVQDFPPDWNINNTYLYTSHI